MITLHQLCKPIEIRCVPRKEKTTFVMLFYLLQISKIVSSYMARFCLLKKWRPILIFISIVLIDQLPPLPVSYFNHLESWDTVLFQTPDSSTAFLSLSPVLTNPRFTFT